MAKKADPSLRETAVSNAAAEFQKATAGRVVLDVEMIGAEVPDPDVLMFRACVIEQDVIRAAIVYDFPGRNQVLYAGTDGTEKQVLKWLKAHGVPAAKLLDY